MLCPSGIYPTVVPVVRLVLVLAVALVSAGADTYECIHWGYFQHTLAEHLALLLVVIHEDHFSRVDTTVSLLGGVYHRSVLYNDRLGFLDRDAIEHQNYPF